jgi:hypothetical protein
MVNGVADVNVITPKTPSESPGGKAFLRVKFEDGSTVDMTLNLAQMIGGAAKGTAQRLGYQHD